MFLGLFGDFDSGHFENPSLVIYSLSSVIATFAECAAAQRGAAPRRGASRRSVWWVRSFNHRPILCQLGIARGAESHRNASYRA